MREVDFPIERDPAEAWPDFVGWRINYEQAAYAVAAAVDAVPALWSGPRRHRRPGHPAHPPAARPTARLAVRPTAAGPGSGLGAASPQSGRME